ncbi:MAG: helicase, partial [Bryobacterales bacterium]|nr:helicase [Bryobacterales bacterium]
MLALHAGFRDRNLIVWGESTPDGKRRRARKSRHPLDAGGEALRAILVETGVDISDHELSTSKVWLPSTRGGPLPSSPLMGETAQDGDPQIAPWEVTTAALKPATAETLLCYCVNKQLLRPGAVVSLDLAFWTAAMRFAGGLVARQQFLPDLIYEDGEFRARWRAACVGRDDDRLHGLAAAMPASARALTPEIARETLLNDFLDTLIDDMVRGSCHSGKAIRGTVHDAWVVALHSTDGKVSGSDAELRALQLQVREWRRPISTASSAPVRLCFRLEEPEADGTESWRVRYLLQYRSDPSLLIPADAVWKTDAKAAAWKPAGPKTREHLLFSLGQASGV